MVYLSFLPFPPFMCMTFWSVSMSSFFRDTASLTLSPEEYISISRVLCLRFVVADRSFCISAGESTTGSFRSFLGRLMSYVNFLLSIWP